MRPTAVSQVIESAGKLALGLGFTALAQRAGLPSERVAACAIFGITVGSALSMIYLFAVKGRKAATRVPKKGRGVMREILKISAPITLGAVVISLSGVIDTALISSRLQSAGFSAEVQTPVNADMLSGNFTVATYSSERYSLILTARFSSPQYSKMR